MGEWVWLKKFEAGTAPELRPSCLSLLRKVGLPRGCETPPVGIGPYSVGKRLASKKEVLRSSLAAWWVKDPWSLLWRGFNPGPGERLHAVDVAKKRGGASCPHDPCPKASTSSQLRHYCHCRTPVSPKSHPRMIITTTPRGTVLSITVMAWHNWHRGRTSSCTLHPFPHPFICPLFFLVLSF